MSTWKRSTAVTILVVEQGQQRLRTLSEVRPPISQLAEVAPGFQQLRPQDSPPALQPCQPLLIDARQQPR